MLKKSHNQAKLIASTVGRCWIKIRNLICFQFISIFQRCQGQSTGGRGLFFIWVLLLTALFHKAIWLCAYKTEVRVGQMVLGINQAGYAGQCMCVCVYKTPPSWLKRHRSDPRTCRGLLDGRRLKTMTEMCNLRGERVWLGLEEFIWEVVKVIAAVRPCIKSNLPTTTVFPEYCSCISETYNLDDLHNWPVRDSVCHWKEQLLAVCFCCSF